MLISKVNVKDIENGLVDITSLEGGEHLGYVLFTRLRSENKIGDLIIFIEDHDLNEICIEKIEEIKANANRKLPPIISDMTISVGRMFIHGDMDDENALIRVEPKDGSAQFSYNDMITLENILELINNKSDTPIMCEFGGKTIAFK
jgi:hypothetical protein